MGPVDLATSLEVRLQRLSPRAVVRGKVMFVPAPTGDLVGGLVAFPPRHVACGGCRVIESHTLAVVGLGPSGLERLPTAAHHALLEEDRAVIMRTIAHPAAAELAEVRAVVACDDLYESATDFDEVYEAIAGRVLKAASLGRVAYAVPGSALIGERTVNLIREGAAERGLTLTVLAGESFLDLLLDRTGVDPIASGLQIIDGRDMPDPLPLHVPTVITQVDRSVVVGDVALVLGAVLEPGHRDHGSRPARLD